MASQIKEVIDKMSGSFPSVYGDINKMKNQKDDPEGNGSFARSASKFRNPTLTKGSLQTVESKIFHLKEEQTKEMIFGKSTIELKKI
jgi:hypothetical protein